MKKFNLKHMIKGWLIGSFIPTLLDTEEFELAIKRYKKGDYDKNHYHIIATEYTIIVSGKVKMNGEIYEQDDIIIISPKENTDFEALEDSVTVVVKYPGVPNDKYNI